MDLPPIVLKTLTVTPPLFCAPMAGISHSAFRRLVADFGGQGALFTEMLSGPALLHEKIGAVPFTKRRAVEGLVWYQLALSGAEDIPLVIDRLKSIAPAALDVNAACPAPEILPRGFGAALFRDSQRFAAVLAAVRRSWEGVLTVKCRIGDEDERWKELFVQRLKIMENEGVDALFIHPRFFHEKLKRKARWEIFEWVASKTRLPVIANGDIVSKKQVNDNKKLLAPAAGLMVGRMAIVKPWIFRELSGRPVVIDYASVWSALYRYVLEDFPVEKALGRIKEFSKYFAQNFLFGHEFYRGVQAASSLNAVYANALRFLEATPTVTNHPTVSGL